MKKVLRMMGNLIEMLGLEMITYPTYFRYMRDEQAIPDKQGYLVYKSTDYDSELTEAF